jgi:hypothetical protein
MQAFLHKVVSLQILSQPAFVFRGASRPRFNMTSRSQ